MKRTETNAIIAGLRLLQRLGTYDQLPEGIWDVWTDGGTAAEVLTDVEIDALCQSINFGKFDAPAAVPAPNHARQFEISRTHSDSENEGIQFICDAGPECNHVHIWTVHQRIGSADLPKVEEWLEWISDHATEQHARAAAEAYKTL